MTIAPKRIPANVEAFQSHAMMLLKGVYNDYFSMLSEATKSFSDEKHHLSISKDVARKLLHNNDAFLSSFAFLLQESFKRYLSPSEAKKKSTKKLGKKQKEQALEERLSKLKLVEADELEKQLLVSRTISKLLGDFPDELSALNMRIEHAMKLELEVAALPVAPRYLFESLVNATEKMNLKDEQAGPAIIALAEVMEDNYEHFLEDLNEFLARRGVLPDLDTSAIEYRYDEDRKLETSKKKRQETLGALVETSRDDGEGLSEKEIQQAFANLIRNASQNPALKQHLVTPDFSAEPATVDEFLQGFHANAQLPNLTNNDAGYLSEASYQPLSEKVSNYMAQSQSSVDESSANTISMLSMMFDQVNTDQNVSEQMKTLVNYMQGPMMKAALLDPTFFSDMENPAQRLMDTIADAGATWTPTEDRKRDSLYNKVASVVEKVNNEFEDDYSVFDECQEDLDLFIKAEKRRARLIEERMISAEKAKARTQTARRVAHDHINNLMSRRQLSDTMTAFLEGPWNQALFYIHNKEESTTAPDWLNAMELESRLMKALTDNDEKLQDAVISAMEQKLDYVGITPIEANRWLDKLSAEFCTANDLNSQYLVEEIEVDDIFDANESTEPATPPPVSPADKPPADLPKMEVAVDIEAEVGIEAEEETESEPDQYDIMAADLTPNAWVKRSEADGSTSKVRVAAIVKATDTVVLVNRNGSKSQTIPRKEFANLLRQGDMSIIENGMMFDRALESVIHNLRV